MKQKLLSLLKRLLTFLKKLAQPKKMQTYDDLINRAQSYMTIYQGQEFQCINAPKEHLKKLGKIFKLLSIDPSANGQLFALFSDNSRVHIDALNKDFFMISPETPALSEGDVIQMYKEQYKSSGLAVEGVKPATEPGVGPIAIPDDLKELQTLHVDPKAGLRVSGSPRPAEAPVAAAIQTTDIFGMFSSSTTKLNIAVELTMPKMSLLQVMYDQAVNKDEFVAKLASYIKQNITEETVKSSIINKLDRKRKNEEE